MKNIVLFGFIFLTFQLLGQSPFSYRDDYGFEASQGYAIIELDSTYGTFGLYVRDWNDKTYGIYYAEFSKKNGKLSKLIKHHDNDLYIYYPDNNNLYFWNNDLEFIIDYSYLKNNTSGLKSVTVKDDTLSLINIATDSQFNIKSFQEAQIFDSVKIISSYIYYPQFGNGQSLLYFTTNDTTYIKSYGDPEKYNSGAVSLVKLKVGYLIANLHQPKNQSGSTMMIYTDEGGNEIDKFIFPKPFDLYLGSPNKMIALDSTRVLITSYKYKYDDVEFKHFSKPVLVIFDHVKKKITRTIEFTETIYNSWDAAYKNLKYTHDGNIIYGGEYTYYVPERDQRNRDIVIGKIDKEGNELWRKRYTILEPVIDDATFYHWLHDLEPTSDGNYICYGEVWGYKEEAGKPVNEAWLFKINEDGDIVNIDTTSTTTWIEKSALPISIYPNPATDMIYINQNDTKNITYEVFDLSGRKVKTIESKDAFHSYMMDISTFTNGTYFIKIIKDSKQQGVLRFEKI